MEKRTQGKQSRAYALFTGVMILCCLGLYLGRSLISSPEEAAPAPPLTPEAATYPSQEAFVVNLQDFGLKGQLLPEGAALPSSCTYQIQRQGLEDCRLTLSLRGSGVCAFLLEMPMAPHPGALPDNATPIETDLYERDLALWEEEQLWRKDALAALCIALDVNQGATAVDANRFFAQLEETLADGTEREDKAGTITFSCYVLAEGDVQRLCAAGSRE